MTQENKPENWHRFFGAGANNEAWTLVELPAAEVDRKQLLDAAHAAAWHWQHIGTELNRMRALMLLACAHAHVGLGATALAFADEMRTWFLAQPDVADMELAFVHTIHAYAASAAAANEQHARSYSFAIQAIATIADEKDREIVQRVFRHVPAPET